MRRIFEYFQVIPFIRLNSNLNFMPKSTAAHTHGTCPLARRTISLTASETKKLLKKDFWKNCTVQVKAQAHSHEHLNWPYRPLLARSTTGLAFLCGWVGANGVDLKKLLSFQCGSEHMLYGLGVGCSVKPARGETMRAAASQSFFQKEICTLPLLAFFSLKATIPNRQHTALITTAISTLWNKEPAVAAVEKISDPN